MATSLIGTPREHEAGLIRFLRPDRRSRNKELLAKPQRRTKLLGTLPHTIRHDLDESYMTTHRGRLAYFHGEDIDARFILERTA